MAVANHPAVGRQQRRLIDEGRFDVGPDLGAEVEPSFEVRQQSRLASRKFGFQLRQQREGSRQTGQIAGRAAAGGDSRRESLQIVALAQLVAQVAAEHRVVVQFLDVKNGWQTHYGKFPARLPTMSPDERLWLLGLTQCSFWLPFTVLLGGGFAALGAATVRKA